MKRTKREKRELRELAELMAEFEAAAMTSEECMFFEVMSEYVNER